MRQFPTSYADSYFFSDLCAGWIHRLDTSVVSNDFATGITNPVDLQVDHDGNLYYLARNGAVMRVRWDHHLVGDVNNDGVTNEADMFYLINYFYGGGPAPVQGGDVDGNGTINTNDLTYLVSYLLGRGPTPM